MNAFFDYPHPVNEPLWECRPGSPERAQLTAKLAELRAQQMEIPLIIGGQEVRTGKLRQMYIPHDHQHVLCDYHIAGKKEMLMAIDAALEAKKTWENMDWNDRSAIFLRAAELIGGKYRALINAATMLEQSKTIQQADGDASAESVDIFKYMTYLTKRMYETQPPSPEGTWNQVEYLPLEGFVLAISPFNFAACVALLATLPTMVGNTVVWKPSSTAVYSNYIIFKILMEAGLPAGVINFIPCSGREMSPVLTHPMMAGINFTGSTDTLQTMWKEVGNNIHNYKGYPRIVGETGGKDFMFVHNSVNKKAFVANAMRSAFEHQGQKCSCASRAYIPASIWPELKQMMIDEVKSIKMGPIEDFTNFMGAITDRAAFDKINEYIKYAQDSPEAEVIVGGGSDATTGYFIEPTLIVTTNPHFKTMEEEIFGPVLSIYIYDDEKLDETIKIADETSPYGLTGGIYAQDRAAISKIRRGLAHAAGNLYVNGWTIGAPIMQAPFGGVRKSGTNDKVGILNLLRWVSVYTIKETLDPVEDYRYPHMEA